VKKALLALLAVAGLATWALWPAAEEEGIVTETEIVRVERGDIELRVTATGEIRPFKEVELKSKASGEVVRFRKEPGDPVEKDELIAELDKRTEQRNLSLAEADLMRAEAELELTRLQYTSSLKTAQSGLAGAREDAKQKKAELDRLENLSAELVPQNDLGKARLEARLAEERLRQAEAALELIQGRRGADEKLASVAVQRARVAVEDARERLDDTEIRSPIRGILLQKLVEEGQIVASGIHATTGGTLIAIVADVSTLLVETNVDETDIAKVKKGMPATIKLLTGSSERFDGHVDLIPPKAELDSNITVFKVRVVMEGSAFGTVRAGMTSEVSILVEQSKDTLLLPSEAVRIEKKKKVVDVPDGEGKRAVPVKTGLEDGIKTQILEGLEENAEVVVTRTKLPEAERSRRR
jgi:multidrug efflux pump subunit AcrA (membrane-fusion protein)